MKITNKFGLPEAFLSFARNGKYDKGSADISVTTLIDAPRVNILKQQNSGDIKADVVDMIWPLLGTAVHHILDSADPRGNVITEERLFANINGWVVSGQVDHQEQVDGKVYVSDYKVTSVWSVIYGKEDWVRQLNCYAQLLRMDRGAEIGGVRIVAILRDWQKREAQLKPDYPQAPVVSVDIDLWDEEKAMAYMVERVSMHQTAQMAWDTMESIVECSDEERWTKPSTWAIKKKGNKRAARVFETEEAAVAALPSYGTGHVIEHRKGGRTRCEQYCSVSDFCTQWAMERLEEEAPDFFGAKDD